MRECRELRGQKALGDSAGRVFWSEGTRFGTLSVGSYLSGMNRGELYCQLCLGFVLEETDGCVQK